MLKLLQYDSKLTKYGRDIEQRVENYGKKRQELLPEGGTLSDFANGHHYFGIHRLENGDTVCREWAPGADALHLYGDFNGWNQTSHPMKKLPGGVFELTLTGDETLKNGQKYKILTTKDGTVSEHISPYATYVTQDKDTYIWSSEVRFEEKPFDWQHDGVSFQLPLLIYECHVGMAEEKPEVGTYRAFMGNVLPRIAAEGYNTIQIMAVMEHPYYASFGYQVSNFFAASSRFGPPEDLKALIDAAHGFGIRVLLDVVHSHAVGNEREGLYKFDGTAYQFFHDGPRGDHSAWGTKLFDYGKNEVLHFLLSNLKFWLEEYHFDGFRFDGVTSMLYRDHGLGTDFDSYGKYFSDNTDNDAVTYLMLANALTHELRSDAVTVAEDMSGMPGLCLPQEEGGLGFDYRLSMGVPDLWIHYLKDLKDEDWSLWQIWYELTLRRPHEKTVGYAESHDQALVGDKTIMFRLCDREMYDFMNIATKNNMVIDRGMALHKIIRLLTFSLSGEGYLNFMGNEFGHPEWIDFPREGNGWSHAYCRRQWSLADNPFLRYQFLRNFDHDMLELGKREGFFKKHPHNLFVHESDKILVYERNGDIFAFNLHPERSFTGYFIPVPSDGDYQAVLTTDDEAFGGFHRIDHNVRYHAEQISDERSGFLAYLPSRTGIVYRKV